MTPNDPRLPQNIIRFPERLAVKDLAAFHRLNELVRECAASLFKLGEDPVAIATSPNRFDDAWTYPWQAVRCGTFFSEKDSYMGKFSLDRDILSAPLEAKEALKVLEQLEAAGWRDLFGDAFEVWLNDQTLALVVQDGFRWLVFSSNNATDDGDRVYAVWDNSPMEYYGECRERFDWSIQNKKPLEFLGNLKSP